MHDDEEPSFSQLMLMISNQQHNDQMQRQQEHDEEREDCQVRFEDQREECHMQMQMHQESMRQQAQFMTTVVRAMLGHQRQPSIVPPTLPPVEINNNNDAHGQREEGAS